MDSSQTQAQNPKANRRFQKLPRTLVPPSRHNHRVHLQSFDLGGEILPSDPEATDDGWYWPHRDHRVTYYRPFSDHTTNTMTDSKGDLRSRSESPRRARAAREKYWSYRHVHPEAQRKMLHIDYHPPTDKHGKPRGWSEFIPVLPSEAHVLVPSKRQLFEKAQKWPRPPRRHFSEKSQRSGEHHKQYEGSLRLMAANEGWAFHKSGVPRKSKLVHPGYSDSDASLVRTVGDGCVNELLHESRNVRHILDVSPDGAGADKQHFGGWEHRPWVSCSELTERWYSADGEAVMAEEHERNVDALFDAAEQKRAVKVAAKRNKLQKCGWDVWEADDILSPRTEWEEVDSLDGEDFELL